MGLPSVVRSGVPEAVLDHWSLPRRDAEDLYAEAFEREDRAALRWLARNDRYFLLTCLLGRPDLRHDWLFTRCREVEADPDDYIDLWAREHYKALDVDTPVWTTRGWKRHGDLRFGDTLFAPDGSKVRVIANTGPMGGADCYDVGGVVAAGDHLWPAQIKRRTRVAGGRDVVYSTEMVATRDVRSIRLPNVRPLDGVPLSAAVPPYVLGVWLGDGHAACGRVTCADADLWSLIDWPSVENAGPYLRNLVGLMPRLREIGVLGNKHVPDPYLRSAPKDRLALLQGLMDTDGHVSRRGTATFVNTNERLVDAVHFLAGSLGMRAHKRRYDGFWQVSFQAYQGVHCPFRLARKRARCKVGTPNMKAYRPVPVPTREVNCIQVEGGLYLAGRDLLPTHNSTIITFAGIIQEILRDPEITIGIFCHDRPTAKGFLRQIKREFEENRRLVRLFPDVLWGNPGRQAPSWSEDGGLTVRRKSNPKEATVEAWGIIAGMPTGKHFRLRVYDDLINEEHVTTPEMVKKATTQWELSEHLGVRPSLGGRCWHIGTRYSFGDTYGIILGRKVLRERRHAATHDGSFEGRPVFLTQAEWDRKKQNSSKSTIAAQMLLNPLAGSETKFDVRLLQYWSVRPKRVNIYITCDPSKGRGASSDRTALSVTAVDINRNKYIIDGWCHRMNLSRRWHLLRDAWKRWTRMPGVQNVYVGYEQFGLQTDIEYFEERMQIEQISFPIEELKWPRQGPKSKADRIERLEPDIRTGRWRLPKVIEIDEEGNITPCDPSRTRVAQEVIAAGETWRVARPIHKKDEDDRIYDWMALFLEEFTFFPFAPHDDILDACSRIYDMDPTPPIYYGEEDDSRRDGYLDPEVYVDGV